MSTSAPPKQPGPVDASRPEVSAALSFLESANQHQEPVKPAPADPSQPKKIEKKKDPAPGSLAELFRKSVGDDGNIIAEGDKQPDPAPVKPAQSTEPEKISGVETVEYESLPVSKTIKEKFGRFKQNEDALKAEIAKRDTELEELRKKAADVKPAEPVNVKETKEYQEIAARLAAQEETVQKIAIEKSPAFVAKYDKPIQDRFGKIGSLLSGVKSDDAKREIASIVQAAAGISTAMESEADFYSKIAEIDGVDDVPATIKSRVLAQLEQVREIAQGREQALVDWRKSADEIRSAESAQRAGLPGMAVQVFDKILSITEQEEAESFAAFRKFEQFKFDETVSAPLASARGEIEKSSATGVVTPELMRMAVDGAHARFYKSQFTVFRDALKATYEELQQLKEKSRRIDESDPSRGRQSSRQPAADDGPKSYPKGSALVANMRKVMSGEMALP